MSCPSEKPEFLCTYPDLPPAGHIFAPFIELQIRDMFFKTGNESYLADPHKMAIKSMQYGLSQGNGGIKVDFELVAEGSTGYREIVDRLNKAIGEATTDIQQNKFRFGWLRKFCGSEAVIPQPASPWILILPTKMSANIDGGVAKIKVECNDLLYRSFSRRIQENKGDEDNLFDLKTAIRELCSTNDPVMEVEFRNFTGDGEIEFKNSSDPEGNGPKGVFQGNQLPLLSTIRNWLNTTPTVNKRGCYFQYDPVNAKLIIQEDPECKSNQENCDQCAVKASYIVNGGNCSPVISFSPNIEYVLDAGGGGGGSGSPSTGQNQFAQPTTDEKPIENSGSGNQTSINADTRTVPPEAQAENAKEGIAVNTSANKKLDLRQAIEGELTIMGDPSWHEITGILARYVSIAVVSPFSLGGEKGECQWLAKPPLNVVLSNKKWFVKGVDHQIESGKFVTKLKVTLAAGAAELPVGSSFGGTDDGFVPDHQGKGEYLGQT